MITSILVAHICLGLIIGDILICLYDIGNSIYDGIFYKIDINISNKISFENIVKDYLSLASMILWSILYGYSFCEMHCLKTKKWLIKVLKNAGLIVDYLGIEVIYTNAVNRFKYKYITKLLKDGVKPSNLICPIVNDEYDMCIITIKQDKILLYDNAPVGENIDNYIPSSVQFLSVCLVYRDEKYLIDDLYTESSNYYIVNNVFNNTFFKHYVFKKYNVFIPNNNYVIEILDDRCKHITITDVTTEICIRENDYVLKKFETREEEEVQVNSYDVVREEDVEYEVYNILYI